jgi:hypothetical protein
MSGSIDFEGINKAALGNGRALLQQLIPGGKFRGLEYIVLNPRRADKTLGSFKINYRSGVWMDFATGDGGGDLISLVAYLRDLDQGSAARELAERSGVPFVKTNGYVNPNGLNGRRDGGSAATNETLKVYPWGGGTDHRDRATKYGAISTPERAPPDERPRSSVKTNPGIVG